MKNSFSDACYYLAMLVGIFGFYAPMSPKNPVTLYILKGGAENPYGTFLLLLLCIGVYICIYFGVVFGLFYLGDRLRTVAEQ